MRNWKRMGLLVVGLFLAHVAPALGDEPALARELRALESLRNGLKTPLDTVDARGEELLKQYPLPQDQGQILFTQTHIHAQSGMRTPKQILKYGAAALETKMLTPAQRATIYSYRSSAHEVDSEVADFSPRRRKAVAELLAGLAELQAFKLPALAPELPVLRVERGDGLDPAEAALNRARADAARRARAEVERTRELVFRRQVLKDQVKWLYYREPLADDELRELATKSLGAEQAAELVATAKTERERIEKARAERKK